MADWWAIIRSQFRARAVVIVLKSQVIQFPGLSKQTNKNLTKTKMDVLFNQLWQSTQMTGGLTYVPWTPRQELEGLSQIPCSPQLFSQSINSPVNSPFPTPNTSSSSLFTAPNVPSSIPYHPSFTSHMPLDVPNLTSLVNQNTDTVEPVDSDSDSNSESDDSFTMTFTRSDDTWLHNTEMAENRTQPEQRNA